ncbi:uncharacterized protein LOC129285710 [Prosopis cineraria]|uniref:uncharacterized protein LOC129285710 n=1 Tax=Prosopis cineraria TaxID=364024 RepID=UPI0024107683|nr:uncharacterized protein LOC129285710 [Prosopis cineraria]
MSTTTVLFVSTFLFLSPLLSSSTATGDGVPSAYEVLGDYHFPEGILPKGVVGYELDRSTGKFRAYLNGSCSFSLEGSYQLSYKSTISGYISKDRLANLSGVSVKVLLFWLNIVEVSRSGDELGFSVGITSASFPLDNFFVCPQCGCGLDCDNLQARKLKLSPSVSSM